MTIVIGWWAIPLALTVALLVWALPIRAHERPGPYPFDFPDFFSVGLRVFAALTASLAAWLVWALLR